MRGLPRLDSFKGMFNRLVKICGDAIDANTRDERLLLETIAGLSEESEGGLADDAVKSVFVMTTFRQRACYLSFV